MACVAMNMPALVAQLKKHEGVRLKPYTDTVGKLTIGIGRNLVDRGITLEEAEAMAVHDITEAATALCAALPWFTTLDEVRQRVLIDLAFNVGSRKALEFVRMLAAMQRKDWDTAAKELWASRWANQVQTDRSHRLVMMLKTGQAQP